MDLYPTTALTIDEIPQSLRWLRGMRKMTLKEAAAASGLSFSFISDLEHGRVKPSLDSLPKLARAYGAPLSLMIGAVEEARGNR